MDIFYGSHFSIVKKIQGVHKLPERRFFPHFYGKIYELKFGHGIFLQRLNDRKATS
jgi:hypothetical protein